MSTKIRSMDARWLRVPIPRERQHTSDFGRLKTFDMALVRIRTESGLEGFGEAKAAVGSSGECASLITAVERELAPPLIGRDAREITRLWETSYNGTRDHYALTRGRGFPALGRRGMHVAALGAIDVALHDLVGKALGVPVVQLLGGTCRDVLPAYASGGWADAEGIGSQLQSYVDQGFRGVKMRVGCMDGTVDTSVERVRNARESLGRDIDLMVDGHGTFSVSEAKRFAREVEDCGLRWFEEPVNSDDRTGLAEVRASTSIPIAVGESEFTRFDLLELLKLGAVDVLQPDTAIIGGLTEARRVGELAHAFQRELAPHLWGSALSFSAGLHLAFSSPAATVLEYSLGANPLLHDLVVEELRPTDGRFEAPTAPGLGVTPREDFIAEFTVDPNAPPDGRAT
ncbi:MAG: mandelate racemase/muconate lactonizing enzyme family protein [Planctomycetota bacterium]